MSDSTSRSGGSDKSQNHPRLSGELYPITIQFVPDEMHFKGSCSCWPDLCVYEKSFFDAYSIMVDLIDTSIDMLIEAGKAYPSIVPPALENDLPFLGGE